MTGDNTAPRTLNYPVGIALAVTGAVALSSGGILLRSVESASGWQIMIYRSATFILLLLAVIAVRNRGRVTEPFREMGGDGLLVAVTLGVGFIAYVFAILNTTVANVMFILSGVPVFAALLGRVILKEPIRAFTWALIAASVCGIGIMVANGLDAGQATGNFSALACGLSFAIAITMFRRRADHDMLPATCLGGLLALLCALVLAEGYTVSPHDLLVCIALGAVQVGVGFICYTYAPRFIPAAEVALLGLLETILSPLWVWIGVGEVPTQATLVGGLMVFGCVVLFSLKSLADQKRAAARARAAPSA